MGIALQSGRTERQLMELGGTSSEDAPRLSRHGLVCAFIGDATVLQVECASTLGIHAIDSEHHGHSTRTKSAKNLGLERFKSEQSMERYSVD